MISRKRTAEILDSSRTNDPLSTLFDIFLIALILSNVTAVVIGTIPSIERQYGTILYWFELLSVPVFSIEYIARIWTAVESHPSKAGEPAWKVRLRYAYSPLAIIDLLAIAPFYLGILFAIDLRILRLFRLIRVAKLGRYSRAWQTLMEVLQEEYRILVASLLLLVMLVIFTATGVYLFERDVQPEVFDSIPKAMWWAIVTLATVGYGDIVPLTSMGKFFTGVMILIGMAMVALPAGILASSFTEHLRKRRDTFRVHVQDALQDGRLDEHEWAELDQLGQSLGLSSEDTRLLMDVLSRRYLIMNQKKNATHCPHCKKSLH